MLPILGPPGGGLRADHVFERGNSHLASVEVDGHRVAVEVGVAVGSRGLEREAQVAIRVVKVPRPASSTRSVCSLSCWPAEPATAPLASAMLPAWTLPRDW